MRKKILFISIFILYYLLVCSLFIYIDFKFDRIACNDYNTEMENITVKIPTGKEVIDEYKDKYNNNDVVGEVRIINTDYKEAVMQSKDNEYYLNHLEDGTYNFMGSIYLDFRIDIENDNKLLIFGHNSSNIDMPFKILENYYSESYYKKHNFIEIATNSSIRKYEIYSVMVEFSDFSYMKTEFNDSGEWFNHIISFKNKSMYDTGVSLNKNDNILILQTCSTHPDYRKYNKKYLLIVGKEVFNS